MRLLSNSATLALSVCALAAAARADPTPFNVTAYSTPTAEGIVIEVTDPLANNLQIVGATTLHRPNLLYATQSPGCPSAPFQNCGQYFTVDGTCAEAPLPPVVHTFPDGFDIVYTYPAQSQGPRRVNLGKLGINGVKTTVDPKVRLFDKDSLDGPQQALNSGAAPVYGPVGGNYSPVQVVSGRVPLSSDSNPPASATEYVIGASIQYAIVDYAHPIACTAQKEVLDVPAELALGIRIGFALNPPGTCQGGNSYVPEADFIPAGQSRVYTVSYRFARASELPSDSPYGWLKVLEPYRAFFQKTYGAPRYVRETAPVFAANMADQDAMRSNAQNFYFRKAIDPLPVVGPARGWDAIIARLQSLRNSENWTRIVLHRPSGMFNPATLGRFNWPFNFTSHWDACGLADTAAFAAYAPDNNIGLYWGQSVQPVESWDAAADFPPNPIMDPDDCASRGLCLRELDRAVSVGSRYVCLDQFGIVNPRKASRWLEELTHLAPAVKFVTEVSAPDYLHVLAPTWHTQPVFQLSTELRPFILADFLIPGHETWIQVSDGPYDMSTPQTQLVEQLKGNLNAAAENGLVPLRQDTIDYRDTFPSLALDPTVVAAESWLTTVPAALRTPYFPVLSGQPSATYPNAQGDLELAVSSSDSSLSYQWYLFRAKGPTNTPFDDMVARNRNVESITLANGAFEASTISGAQSPTLIVQHPTAWTRGAYRCKISNGPVSAPTGVTWTAPIVVTQLPEPSQGDLNHDGVVDPDDLADAIAGLFSTAHFDYNGDCVVNPDDFSDFVADFFPAP